MLRKAFNRNSEDNSLIRLVLVFALTFATLHVALHDLDMGGGLNEHEQCQACRLNHVPLASLPLLSLLAPLQLLAYVLPIADTEYQLSLQLNTQRARAPPLF